MKNIRLNITIIIGLLVILGSCELDNYEGPDSQVFGGIYDIETNELIQQEPFNGTVIDYVELGWENPPIQTMRFMPDGTYRNNLMFSGSYTMVPARGNFVPIEEDVYEVEGETQIDFNVQPYIRLHDVNLARVGDEIVATFRIEQTVGNNVLRIGIFAHREPQVSDGFQTVRVTQNLNAVIDPSNVHTISINLPSNSHLLVPGWSYYFRVGALIDAPQAKYNYAPMVRLTI